MCKCIVFSDDKTLTALFCTFFELQVINCSRYIATLADVYPNLKPSSHSSNLYRMFNPFSAIKRYGYLIFKHREIHANIRGMVGLCRLPEYNRQTHHLFLKNS